jgi:two-component system, LuxR family, sensor kinase FixL
MRQEAISFSWIAGWRTPGETFSLQLNREVRWTALFVFIGYYLGAKLGFALTFHPHPVSVLWPPNAILLGALLLAPSRAWWILILAALPAHWLAQLQSQVPPGMIFCWFISDSCEALIGAGCIRYLAGYPFRLDRLRNVAIFCFCGVLLGPFLSSFLDCGFVALNHWGSGSYWEIWRIRFTSNVLAALTIAPLIVTWVTAGFSLWRKITWPRFVEGTCLLVGLVLISFLVFNRKASEADSALLYAPLPFLLWAAVRFRTRGSTTAIAAVALLAIWGVGHGNGPFSENPAERNALYVQLFLIFMSAPLLFLSALIEERSSAEEALREREARICLAAETANLALWTIDFERGNSWMNDKGRDLFGFAPNEPLSREAFLERVHPENRRRVDEAIQAARGGSEAFEIEYRLLRPDGETRWIIARGRYLRNDTGQLNEFIGVAIDVTGQVRADLELRLQREEMIRLSRIALMGELTASLAHELNQPLTAIATNAAAGKRSLGRSLTDPSMFEEIFQDIFTDAQRAGAVIHGIRGLVRKNETSLCAVNMNDLICDVLRLLHSDLISRATAVETELAPDIKAIQGDPIHLQQVLLNLILNALEAMHETPTNKRRILVSTAVSDGFVEVKVRDHGVGLPRNDPDKVFAHFFTTKPNGMGMGLAIVRSIVEAHGGDLGARNVDGGGALFFFRLPRG